MEDRLESLLQRFELRARVFHKGELHEPSKFDSSHGFGHLHVVQSGEITVQDMSTGSSEVLTTRVVSAPSLVFYSRPTDHALLPQSGQYAELVCGEIDFGLSGYSVLSLGLPSVITLPIETGTRLETVIGLMLQESQTHLCGQQVALNRICELVVLELLRYLMAEGAQQNGLLAGLADAQLAKSLNSIPSNPAEAWTLEQLAGVAGMSRASFANRFKETVGVSVGAYLTTWRMSLAQSLLKKGQSVTQTTFDVGYQSPASMARVFRAHTGLSPRAWLKSIS